MFANEHHELHAAGLCRRHPLRRINISRIVKRGVLVGKVRSGGIREGVHAEVQKLAQPEVGKVSSQRVEVGFRERRPRADEKKNRKHDRYFLGKTAIVGVFVLERHTILFLLRFC